MSSQAQIEARIELEVALADEAELLYQQFSEQQDGMRQLATVCAFMARARRCEAARVRQLEQALAAALKV